MRCPRCETASLDERERDGLLVDACPSCRGVWLDRGELEKLIARAAREIDELEPRASPRRLGDEDEDEDRHRGRRQGKRRWFDSLGDLFD